MVHVGLIAFGHQCVSAPLHLVPLHFAAVTVRPRLGAVTFWRHYILEAALGGIEGAQKRPSTAQIAAGSDRRRHKGRPEATIDSMNSGWKRPRRR